MRIISTEAEIYLDYRRALDQATELETLSQTLTEQVSKEETATGKLTTGWKGTNGEAFAAKAAALRQKLREESELLKNAASALRTTAGNTYRAEMRALEIAKSRHYGKG